VVLPGEVDLQVTMDGRQAARLFREVKVDVLVPMHYESRGHFREGGEELRRVFEEERVSASVCWLKPGESMVIAE
jgi:L-ascorbate metabolism protein UlaG (beta-lactamase superfamily)